MDYVHHVHQSYPFYQDRETKKLARTSCWYVPGRVVRMSSALLEGPFENKQMCHSSSRHLLYLGKGSNNQNGNLRWYLPLGVDLNYYIYII